MNDVAEITRKEKTRCKIHCKHCVRFNGLHSAHAVTSGKSRYHSLKNGDLNYGQFNEEEKNEFLRLHIGNLHFPLIFF